MDRDLRELERAWAEAPSWAGWLALGRRLRRLGEPWASDLARAALRVAVLIPRGDALAEALEASRGRPGGWAGCARRVLRGIRTAEEAARERGRRAWARLRGTLRDPLVRGRPRFEDWPEGGARDFVVGLWFVREARLATRTARRGGIEVEPRRCSACGHPGADHGEDGCGAGLGLPADCGCEVFTVDFPVGTQDLQHRDSEDRELDALLRDLDPDAFPGPRAWPRGGEPVRFLGPCRARFPDRQRCSLRAGHQGECLSPAGPGPGLAIALAQPGAPRFPDEDARAQATRRAAPGERRCQAQNRDRPDAPGRGRCELPQGHGGWHRLGPGLLWRGERRGDARTGERWLRSATSTALDRADEDLNALLRGLR